MTITGSQKSISALILPLLGELTEAIIVIDTSGRRLFANAAAKNLTGTALLQEETPAHKQDCQFFKLDGTPYPIEAFPLMLALNLNQTTENFQWNIHHEDGRSIIAIGTAKPIYDEENQRAGAVLTFYDATERLKQDAELQSAIALKDMLLKEIHHRVKNNLQLVSSLLSLQARQTKDKAANQALSDVSSRVDIIADIHRVLYDGGETNTIDVVSYLSALSSGSLKALAESFDMSLDTASTGHCVMSIEKATSLALAVNELLMNSIKLAMLQKESPHIDLSIEAVDDKLVINFRDHAIAYQKAGFKPDTKGKFSQILINGLRKQLSAQITRVTNATGHQVIITIPVSETNASN